MPARTGTGLSALDAGPAERALAWREDGDQDKAVGENAGIVGDHAAQVPCSGPSAAAWRLAGSSEGPAERATCKRQDPSSPD